MTIRNSVAILPILAGALLAVGACKKNVDPSQFDAGASAAPVVATADTAAAAAAPSAPAPTDSAAPLASLTPPTTPPPAASGTHAGTKAKKNLPECEQARKFCNHPAVKVDKAIENLCTQNKQSCFAKGGTL